LISDDSLIGRVAGAIPAGIRRGAKKAWGLRLRMALLLVLLPWMSLVQAEVPVRIAILAFRPAADVEARWQPLVEYLNGQVRGYRFRIEAFGYRDLETAIARREVDFVFTNPGHYLLMTYRNGLSSPLATLVAIEHGQRLSKFGGVVFTRAGRNDIHSLKDLRGHTIAAVTQGSLGGYQAQAYELLGEGIRIPRDVPLQETGMPHDRVVTEVLDGRADAGFVRTGILEGLAAEGKLDLARIQIVSARNEPGFPLLLSTRLYPEWPFAAMPGVDEDLARRVTAALISIPHGGAVSTALDIHGFTIPTDYEVVHAMLKALRLPPFDAAPEFTFGDIWDKYRWPLVVGALMVATIGLLAVGLVFLNRRLADGRRRVERASYRWQRLLEALGEGVYGVDAQGRCTFINQAALNMLGFAEPEVLGQDQHALFHRHREDGHTYPVESCPVFLTMRDGMARNGKDWLWRKDGSGFPVNLTTSPLAGNGSAGGAVVVFRDISAQQQLEAQLRRDATTDALTGVANRRSFLDALNKELIRFKRFGDPACAAVLMADIDHFKHINDRHGHAIGDEALRHFTHLVRTHLRATDLVGRLGGEEFGILLPVTDEFEALEFAKRLCALVAAHPARTAAGEIAFTVSLGVTELWNDDATPEAVLERADAALYRAKAGGRNRAELAVAQGRMFADEARQRAISTHVRWRSRYACGEPVIDHDHQALFGLANGVLALAIRSYDEASLAAGLKPALEELLARTVEHFSHEEAILRAHNYAQAEAHARSHEALLASARALIDRLDGEGGDEDRQVSRAAAFMVVDMVALHMLKEDRKFFELFKGAQGVADRDKQPDLV